MENETENLIDELRQEIQTCQATIDEQRENINNLMEKLLKAEMDQVEPSEKAKEMVKKMGPMDDLFFNKMGEDKEAIGEIISTITGIKVTVEQVIPQYSITSIGSRSVRLDSMSKVVPQALVKVKLDEDSPMGPKGAKVNIEVQKDNNDDHQFRVYYNGASIIVNETPKSTKFEDIPRAVVIFISSFDVFGGDRMIYRTQLTTEEDGIVGRRPVSEYYVNTKIVDRSTPQKEKIVDLMQLFSDADAYDDEKFPNFSKRKYELKHTEKGVLEVSKEVQNLVDEVADKKEQETTVTNLKMMIKNLSMTVDQALDALELTGNKRAKYKGLVAQK